MKIGILSQKLENNYGGILQNYALQQYLISLGHNPLTIDFRPGDSLFWYCISQIKTIVDKCLGKKVAFRSYSTSKTYRSPQTSAFIRKYIKATRRVQVLTPFLQVIYRFDSVIVGSDQVWRCKYNVLRNTYLTFVRGNCVRLAYAASFGVSEWEYSSTQTALCRSWIKKFRAVSTRELSGVSLCKNNLHISATHVLDPTMLLESSHYAGLCKTVPLVSEYPYLFAYVLDLSDEKRKVIELFAHNKGLKVIMLSAEKNITKGVEYWLASIRDAKFIITDSFHGTVFSVLFKKEFITLVNTERGADRFYSLLNMLNLQNRICADYKTFNFSEIASQSVDWEYIDSVIDDMRVVSRKFLVDNLK